MAGECAPGETAMAPNPSTRPPSRAAVAKQLRARGFSKVYVISGGAASWTSSKLSTRRWKSPSALLPPGSQSKVVESKASVMA